MTTPAARPSSEQMDEAQHHGLSRHEEMHVVNGKRNAKARRDSKKRMIIEARMNEKWSCERYLNYFSDIKMIK